VGNRPRCPMTKIFLLLLFLCCHLSASKHLLVETEEANPKHKMPDHTKKQPTITLNRNGELKPGESSRKMSAETAEISPSKDGAKEEKEVESTKEAEIKEEFGEYDADGSGNVTIEEYMKYHEDENDEKDIKEWFEEEDKNGDGVIDLTEMIALKKEEKKEEFEEHDADRSGIVTLKEYLKKNKPDEYFTEEDITEWFKDEDLNHDGVWTMDESPRAERPKKEEMAVLKLEAEIKEEFEEYDADGSGNVTIKEYMNYHEGESEKDIKEWFKEEDKNGDGVIDLTEMIASKKEKKKEEFEEFDVDGSGKVTLKEWLKKNTPVGAITEEKRTEWFNEDEDLNHDGVLDFAEWIMPYYG